MKRTLDYPPLWLALFAALLWVQAKFLPLGDFGRVGRMAGIAFVLAGLALAIWAIVWMTRARTTVIPHEVPKALVTTGPFAISRNPIYLGDALILAGLGLAWGALSVVLLLPLFIVVITRRFILPEETRLTAAFGHSFAEWAGRVRRWL